MIAINKLNEIIYITNEYGVWTQSSSHTFGIDIGLHAPRTIKRSNIELKFCSSWLLVILKDFPGKICTPECSF